MLAGQERTEAYAIFTPIAQTVNICTTWHDGMNRSRARSWRAQLSARWDRRRVPVFEVALWRNARVMMLKFLLALQSIIYPGKTESVLRLF